MGLLQRLEMRQGQALVMTPQLLQAIKLLQLSHLDLAAYVDAELERNPLLERAEAEAPEIGDARGEGHGEAAEAGRDGGDGDGFDADFGGDGAAEPWLSHDLNPSRSEIEGDLGTRLDNVFPDEGPVGREAPVGSEGLSLTPAPWGNAGGSFDGDAPDFEATLTSESSLHEHLSAQLDLATRDPVERLVGGFLVDAIDEAGYLREDLPGLAERLGVAMPVVERVLALVQGFDPSGVGARDLAECLAIQLREQDRFDPAMQALVSRLDLVAKRDLASLRRLCGVDDEDLADMLSELRRLDPKPGRAFGAGPVEVLVPDVFVRAAPDGSWLVELNSEALPRVLVNQSYYATVTRGPQTDTDKAFLSECLQTANWLTRSLEQRARTILKVASEIVRQQDGFFVNGVAHLRPLNLKTVADAIGMHESTVSRVTSNKSIGTSRGTFEMKYFFTAAIPGAAGAAAHSSEAVRHRIKQLIDGEANDVLSDDALVQRLRGEGVDIARRTVAKYRESLRIPSSIERRRERAAMPAR
ncbi:MULTISPECIES: RNA polymerase factor sigma-54 [Methylobacterium]|jgi:RNA polymerase sigma-54 factor|uniref:RNA polymerase factor sigma-54 n=1 Tax=Methylobacterium TaxID=407 RepID=UPI0008EAB9B7|nr:MULTISPECIES: RNA polymerase factor sigma-54 [Methylobacterium]MBZ6411709.1 RNA polymerase factor sigma-54 [Methylobacterium sp.]MBK3396243.1 RNA polymerase factor sigma-54 [Methylobacterium ajmalii]MBK3410074.1 RNA polymerase factor sigma-54 [Methylobacterium ajmalii]MBK3421300.1 RNA polymerase factor sigma-54 [Methylobacterium ajmalii]SFE43972.1 RNA polymerase, sigma 54 subunit, RpoN/SigL [Methylobacterium sp. yr596]